MSNVTLEKFFIGRFFCIPNYQRDFAWEISNINDLIDDIIESIETATNHYIGTFILSETDTKKQFNVVDGQQRLTAITMLLRIATNELANDIERSFCENLFIKYDGNWKLQLLNDSNFYFHKLLNGETPEPETRSQKFMKIAYGEIETRIQALEGDARNNFLNAVKQLEVMEFVESNDGKAIRTFQTVNDRGKPISNMDKAKSILIYYSNRFLDGKLDNKINDKVGRIFHYFDEIKTIGEENKINVINQRRFSEDSVVRYHFLAYAKDKYDYKATEDYVLHNYLKPTLKEIKGDTSLLEKFIEEYVEDLETFFEAFANIARKVTTNTKYYKLFSILDLSTFLYPLIIRLESLGFLEKQIDQSQLTFFDLIEITDLRVYKIRGTTPSRDVHYLAKDSTGMSENSIKDKLIAYINFFMSDSELKSRLNQAIYGNHGLSHLFIEYDEYLLNKNYDISELREFKSISTVEHIFPQKARFDFPTFGFKSQEEYNDSIHRLGNLMILERSLNSRCSEKNPDEKIKECYGESKFKDPKQINAKIRNRGTSFSVSDISLRAKELTEFSLERWSIL